jgi:hypothetical protein
MDAVGAEATIFQFDSLREYVAYRVTLQKRTLKSLALDMGLSTSVLSRKLNPQPKDTSRFSTEDLEKYIEVTGDTAPIKYLVSKYFSCR